MIHVVFQQADAHVLQQAIALDSALEGEILEIGDDYAVGPIRGVHSESGIGTRRLWWRYVLAGGDYDGKADNGSVDDEKTVATLTERLQQNPAETVWIWAAPNKHDVSGYYWLTALLKDFQGRVYLLYLNNLPFINDKGHIFYPDRLGAIPPKEFIKAKKLARLITVGEFEADPEEWKRLSDEDKHVRLLDGGKKLVQYADDFYDNELQAFITGDWQKAGRIIHQFLNKAVHTTGDAYMLWRLKMIVAGENYEVQGEPKNMKDFEVRRKTV